ncbi:MAG TPA: hypothetical protein PLQ09_01065 [Prolixibacteraceae bacterium]|nr:hypothetical protein [Prolixibacteraceae bacterium]
MEYSCEEVLQQIQRLWDWHFTMRNFVHYQNGSNIGRINFGGIFKFHDRSLKYQYILDKPIDSQFNRDFNAIGHYLNQNVIIRLLGIIQDNKIVSKKQNVEPDYQGSKEVELLLKLRNVIAHESGKFNPLIKEHCIIAKMQMNVLGIDFDIENATEFDLSIDKVIRPLFDGAKRYVTDFYRVRQQTE